MRLKSRTRSVTKSSKAKNRNRLGIAAVEMAMVAPLLLLLIFMMVEASRFLTALHATAGAAREVARLVAVADVDQATAEQHARDVMEHSLFRSDTVQVEITDEPSSVTGFNLITVEVSIDFADVSVIGDPFNLGVTEVSGFSSMLSEQ